MHKQLCFLSLCLLAGNLSCADATMDLNTTIAMPGQETLHGRLCYNSFCAGDVYTSKSHAGGNSYNSNT